MLCFAGGGETTTDENIWFAGGGANCIYTGASPGVFGDCSHSLVHTGLKAYALGNASTHLQAPVGSALRYGNRNAQWLWIGGQFDPRNNNPADGDYEVILVCPTDGHPDTLALGLSRSGATTNFQFFDRTGDSWTKIGSAGSTNVVWTGTDYAVEVEVTTSTVKLWVDGSVEISEFSHTLDIGNHVIADNVGWGTDINVPSPGKKFIVEYAWDDRVILDDQGADFNKRPTTMFEVINAEPISKDSSNDSWTPSAGTNKFDLVDEHTLDSTDYISTTTNGHIQLFGLQNKTTNPGDNVGRCGVDQSGSAINAVIPWMVRNTGTAEPQLAARDPSGSHTNVVLNPASNISAGSPGGTLNWHMEESPDGSAWTWAILDRSFFGVKSNATNTKRVVACGAMILIKGAGYTQDAPMRRQGVLLFEAEAAAAGFIPKVMNC